MQIAVYANSLLRIKSIPVDTGRKLNVYKTFRRRLGRLLNVLSTFNLRPVSTGKAVTSTHIFVAHFCMSHILLRNSI